MLQLSVVILSFNLKIEDKLNYQGSQCFLWIIQSILCFTNRNIINVFGYIFLSYSQHQRSCCSCNNLLYYSDDCWSLWCRIHFSVNGLYSSHLVALILLDTIIFIFSLSFTRSGFWEMVSVIIKLLSVYAQGCILL